MDVIGPAGGGVGVGVRQESQGGPATYLRVSLEVILEKRLVEPRVRDWASGVASCDRLGEAGGPL